MLEICLLGFPEIRGDGRSLTIPRRQARALLYRLASRLESIPREQLCFLFWPDVPESSARRNLSHLLTHVRRALPDRAMLLTEDDCVGLDPALAWSDTAVFTQLETTAMPNLQVQTRQQIVDLYRGPFLASFSLPGRAEYEAWLTWERQVWERLYLESLLALVKEWTVQGAYDVAIHCAERYLATNSLAEEVHNHLIALYAASGDRAAALRQFEQCVMVLERELGVRPLPETRATYETVLEGSLPAAYVTAKQKWMTLPCLDVPSVGREGSLRQLEQAYLRAQSGQGTVALISGEPGIGKSRLLQDFRAQISEQATVLLTGVGHIGGHRLSYQPIVQALSPIINEVYATFDGEPIWLTEASRLWPELHVLLSDMPQPMPGKSDEIHLCLFESLCRLILSMSRRSPCLVLCLDDLHWMDAATLDWLVYLGHRLQGARVLVLGSYRCDEAAVVLELRHGLARLNILTEMTLAGLDETAVYQLLHHLIGSVPNQDRLAVRLHQITGGNPFFLLETVQALRESGHTLAELPSLENLPLSDSMREAVAARLAHLSPVGRQILEASTVLSPDFGFDRMRQVAGRHEMETMDGLDELVARQLLIQKDRRYRFRHDLIQRIVLESLNPVRHQLLRQRTKRFGIVDSLK